MTDKEKSAWIEFIWVVQNFLGNKKSPDYIQHIEQLQAFRTLSRKFRRLENKENAFIRIFALWKSDTRVVGIQVWLITAGAFKTKLMFLLKQEKHIQVKEKFFFC